MGNNGGVQPDFIDAAWQRIRPHVRETPVISPGPRSFGLEFDIVLKLECLQHTGSFKPRGAFNRVLSADVPDAGVIAASGGNHGLAVGYVASQLGHIAEVFVPTKGVSLARDGFRLRMYQRVVWGVPGRFTAQPVPPEIRLDDGFRFQAVDAPGHSPDMTCYLEPDRGWLFSGDLYIASKPRFLRADESVDIQIESLRAVLGLSFDTVFCSHRGVVPNGHGAIREKLDYLVSLRDETRELHRSGRSVTEITRQLLGREPLMSFLTWFHFSKRNLVRACLPPELK